MPFAFRIAIASWQLVGIVHFLCHATFNWLDYDTHVDGPTDHQAKFAPRPKTYIYNPLDDQNLWVTE